VSGSPRSCRQFRVWQDQCPTSRPLDGRRRLRPTPAGLASAVNFSGRQLGQRQHRDRGVRRASKTSPPTAAALTLESPRACDVSTPASDRGRVRALADPRRSLRIDDSAPATRPMAIPLKRFSDSYLKIGPLLHRRPGRVRPGHRHRSAPPSPSPKPSGCRPSPKVSGPRPNSLPPPSGCQRAQGYYFSRPVPPEQIPTLPRPAATTSRRLHRPGV